MTSLSQQAVACSPVHSKLWFSTEPKFDKEYFEKVDKDIRSWCCIMIQWTIFDLQLVKDKPLVLFMKGEPSAPMVI